MANSIVGNAQTSAGNAAITPQMIKQFTDFQRNFKGDPKHMVMEMMRQGKITNPQLQQAMQFAEQFKGMIK